MNQQLQDRLNQIPEKILGNDFLEGKGLGGDINFWVFDYAPEAELQVREYLDFLKGMLAKKHSHLKICHINLLQSLKDYLQERGFVEKAITMQNQKGDDALKKALHGPLHMDKFAPYIVNNSHDASEKASHCDMIFVSGVGSVWPLLRAHELLNSLHSLLGHKPLVLFYPGHYTGQSLHLFNKIPSKNYYRAFTLIP